MTFARRHRRSLASLILGIWVFAVFVGIANACIPGQGLVGHPAVYESMAMGGHHPDQGGPPDCVQFCNQDLPLFAKLKLVQDLPAAQPLLLPSFEVTVVVDVASRVVPTHLAHPPTDVPLYLRSLRLAL